MDRGTWRATVRGVTQSQTRLSDFTHTHTHTHTNAINGEKACDASQDQGGDRDPRSSSHKQDPGGGRLRDPRLGVVDTRSHHGPGKM